MPPVCKHEEAIQSFDEAIRINSVHADAWDNKALVYIAMGMHAQADAALARAGISRWDVFIISKREKYQTDGGAPRSKLWGIR